MGISIDTEKEFGRTQYHSRIKKKFNKLIIEGN
jgi:hypothetical protein